jgi:hypothetical protein
MPVHLHLQFSPVPTTLVGLETWVNVKVQKNEQALWQKPNERII